MRFLSLNARGLVIVCASALIVGCAGIEPARSAREIAADPDGRSPATSAAIALDWAWDIRGDKAVRPIQVFSDGRKTWLQFAARQSMPAVFVGGVPVPFEIHFPHLVLQGKPERIDLIAGHYGATVISRAPAVVPVAATTRASTETPAAITRIRRISPARIPPPEGIQP